RDPAVNPRFVNRVATLGWAWDCCSLNIQQFTFKDGSRNENRVIFAFTLKGIGSFGTENFGQRRREQVGADRCVCPSMDVSLDLMSKVPPGQTHRSAPTLFGRDPLHLEMRAAQQRP